MSGFDTRPFDVEFVVDKVALYEDFVRLRRFSPISIIPLMLHTHISFMYARRQIYRLVYVTVDRLLNHSFCVPIGLTAGEAPIGIAFWVVTT
jgi:hypothetical protein